MNSLKNHFVLFVILIATNMSFSQNRTNTKTISEVKNTDFLKKVKGWYFDDDNGKWIENQNMIYYKSASMRYSFAHRNLDSMTINKVLLKDIPYYVLLINKESGYYEYPTIKEDWKSTRSVKYLIFDKAEYIKIKNLLNEYNEEVVLIDIFSDGELDDRFDKLSNKRILIDIENNIKKVESEMQIFKEKWDKSKSLRRRNKNDFKKYYYESNYKAYRHYFPISNQIIDNKKIIRFLFILDDYDVKNYDILKEYYFETEQLEFKKIFIE